VKTFYSQTMDVLKGKHCSWDECKQFDFLPFTCDGCRKVFCLAHREQSAHKCPAMKPEQANILPRCPICNKLVLIKSGESIDAKVMQHIESGCTQFVVDTKREKVAACSYSKCKALSAPCECKHCRKFFCAEHRLADDHLCPVAKAAEQKQRGGNGLFNPFRAMLNERSAKMGKKDKDGGGGKNAKAKAKGNAKVNPAKARMRMRSVAKGNKNIETKDRFYVEVTFSASLRKKPLTMFFNRKKTVGRILDDICKERNIKNKNHLASARQLVLQCVRTGGELPSDIALHLMAPEFQSGDTILVRYADE